MGQLSSMKEIVDDAKKDKGAKETLLDKENKEKETKMADQQQKLAGKAIGTLTKLDDWTYIIYIFNKFV